MKKIFSMIAAIVIGLSLTACGTSGEPSAGSLEKNNSSAPEPEQTSAEAATAAADTETNDEVCGSNIEEEDEAAAERRISVRSGDAEVIYRLNDGNAADSLYEMLPLTAEVEDYSTNEKIFYPPEELACIETPLAMSDTKGGTLAYYEPWGNVVMFYDGYNENSALYELGHAVSGMESISRMSGTITITVAE